MKKKPSKTLVARIAAYKKLARIFDSASEYTSTLSDAIAHSLKKWHAVAKRDRKLLKQDYHEIIAPLAVDGREQVNLKMNDRSCALCIRSKRISASSNSEEYCTVCPLYKARMGKRCDECMERELISPWHAAVTRKDYKPMIAWLEIADRMNKLYAFASEK